MQRKKHSLVPITRGLRWHASTIAVAVALSACGGGSGTQDAAADEGVPADLATRGEIAMSLLAAAVGGSNLLANPGFESGMASWQDWGNTLVGDGSGASGTSRALRVGTAGGGAGQTVTGVVAGKRYRLSGQARVTDPSETIVLGVNMLDQSGNKLAEQAVRITNTAYAQGSLEVTAPANAAKAQVYVWKNGGPGYAFVDELTFADASATSTAPSPSGGNLMANAGFEAALDSWQNWGNAVAVTGQASSGSYAIRVGTAAGGAGNTVSGIQPGKVYRVSGKLKVSAASETASLGLAFLDAQGNHLRDQNVPVRTTSYTTAQLDVVAPTNASRALVYLWKNAGGGYAYADDISLAPADGTSGAAPAPAPAAPAPAPAPAAFDFGVVPLASWPTTLLQTGRATDAYWVEDGVWAPGGLTRGTFTGVDGRTYEQSTGVSNKVGPNGEVAFRTAWKWPTCCTEIKSYPSIVSGQKPGWYNSWTKPGGFDILLPDGTYSQVYPSGRTPGTFFPLQLPIASLKSSFSYKHMAPPTGRGHLSYDIWLQNTAQQVNGFGPGITHEIMVPLDYWGGYGTYPTRNPQWYDHDVTIDGILFHVYIAKDATGRVLTNFGTTGWKFIVFEPDRPIPAGTLDLAKIINYVSTRSDRFGTRWSNGNEYAVSVELGVEQLDGTGDIQVSNYRVFR